MRGRSHKGRTPPSHPAVNRQAPGRRGRAIGGRTTKAPPLLSAARWLRRAVERWRPCGRVCRWDRLWPVRWQRWRWRWDWASRPDRLGRVKQRAVRFVGDVGHAVLHLAGRRVGGESDRRHQDKVACGAGPHRDAGHDVLAILLSYAKRSPKHGLTREVDAGDAGAARLQANRVSSRHVTPTVQADTAGGAASQTALRLLSRQRARVLAMAGRVRARGAWRLARSSWGLASSEMLPIARA